MLVGRVTGNVVSTNKCDSLRGAKLLIVQPVDLETLQMKDDYVICVDDVGAGEVLALVDHADRHGLTGQRPVDEHHPPVVTASQPRATSTYARLNSMTASGGDSGEKPQNEGEQGLSEGTYEAQSCGAPQQREGLSPDVG